MSVSFTPRPLYLKETPGTHWTGSWVGLRAGLDAKARRKHSDPAVNPTPVVQTKA